MTTAGPRVFRVREDALEDLRRRVAALDRRASRLGTGPIRLREIGRREAGYALMQLDGEAPVLHGWTLAAIVEHGDRRPSLRLLLPNRDLLVENFSVPVCDHCGLRRRRSRTYVLLRAETGELRQVGSGCLRDFLGGHDPERLCRQAEYLARAREVLVDMTAAPRITESAMGVSLSEFAAHAASAVRRHGWVTRQRARRTGEPTSVDRTLETLRDVPELPTAGERELARRALAWGRDLLGERPGLSEFERELIAVAAGGHANEPRHQALVCALVAVYAQGRAHSRHLGQPGVAVTVTVLVERVVPRPSARHGVLRRNELIDAFANRLVWWQTQGAPLEIGDVVRLRGRVARHTHFGSVAVTVLSHCRRADGSGGTAQPIDLAVGTARGEPTRGPSGR
jgi:hypothetical protein